MNKLHRLIIIPILLLTIYSCSRRKGVNDVLVEVVKTLIPILVFPLLLSCNGKTNKTSDSIPEGAVPFEYDFKREQFILMPGTLNDSISVKYLLETGGWAFGFSNNLDFETENDTVDGVYKIQKPMTVQIGQWKQISGNGIDAYYIDNTVFGAESGSISANYGRSIGRLITILKL